MKSDGESKKPGMPRIPLDGSERARLVNMRLGRLAGQQNETKDILSKVRRNPGALTRMREAGQCACQHWFKRGMDDYVPNTLAYSEDDHQFWINS